MQRKYRVSRFTVWMVLCVICLICGVMGLPERVGAESVTSAEGGEIMSFSYPVSLQEPVTDILHGYSIVDNYQWLEDLTNPRVTAWIDEQNQFSRGILEQLPERPWFFEQIAQQLLNTEDISWPVVFGNRIFYKSLKPGDEQASLYTRVLPDGNEELLVDLNHDERILALDWFCPSPDGKMLAYGISENGNEWSILQVMNVETGEVHGDQIPRARQSTVAWIDDTSFYYTRYPSPGDVPAGDENFYCRVYFHQLGTDYREDPMIFGEGLPKNATPRLTISNDRRYLIARVSYSWLKSELYLADLKHEPVFHPVITNLEGSFTGQVVDDALYVYTNYQAPNFKVVKMDLKEALEGTCPPEKWNVVVPEDPELAIWSFQIAGHSILVNYLEDVSARVKVYGLNGKYQGDVELPGLGSIWWMTDAGENGNAYIAFHSFTLPLTLFSVDLKTLKTVAWLKPEVPEVMDLALERVFYTSKDGTQVPLFIMYKKGLQLDGQRPTILSGYGGFNTSYTPVYIPDLFPWLSQGGVYAIACIRGGNEYGEVWHQGGCLENKQNCFDDFIYAAKYLTDKGYTNPDHLGIEGSSNGGLLVGAAMTQAPELFQAVFCQVPVLDMFRFHQFLVGAAWIGEYGNPDVAEEFEWLRAYSPYHNVEEDGQYPAVFFYSGIDDSRVHPMHSMKMTALMQSLTANHEPVILYVEPEAGHGMGKPTSKLASELADFYSFMAWQLGLSVPEE